MGPYIYIAGAGPGDKGLLTLKTYELITQTAQIIIYDRLVSDDILDLIPANVEKIYAGKSCRKHHMTQDEINESLVKYARQNKIILRLKGGDPFIFGRGAEEALYLNQHNIPFEIVPGVNAADGCAAYAGIPLTHRNMANSVRFITGHQQKGQKIDLNWQDLANPSTTLVIYMGLTNLDNICQNLINNGLDPLTPAIAISNGTTDKVRYCPSPLKDFFATVKEADLAPPTIVIIGKVVGLKDKINTHQNQ